MILVDNKKISLLLALFFALCAVASADAQAYGGRAIGASVVLNGSVPGSVFADTGELSSVGGVRTASATSASVPGVLATGPLTTSTSGALSSSQSVAVADDVVITVGDYRITANQVIANTSCICCPDPSVAACAGSTAVGNLVVTNTVTGEATAYTGANQVVQLGEFGTLTINQQIQSDGAITVNGLRVVGSGGDTDYDIIVASARSSLQCLTLVPSAGEVTLTGRVLTSEGAGVQNATVTVEGGGSTHTTKTDKQGRYSIAELDAGTTYFVTATHRSYTFGVEQVTPYDDVVVNLVANQQSRNSRLTTRTGRKLF